MIVAHFIFRLICFVSNAYGLPSKPFHLSGHAQGTTWHITYYASDSVVSAKQIDSILVSIDSSLSLYKPYSEIVRFNNSIRGIVAGAHLIKVVKKAIETSKKSHGLFDITVEPLVRAWGFSADTNSHDPSDQQLDSLKKCVGYRKVFFRDDSLIKKIPCVRIDLNGIAQGYSVDVISAFLHTNGINNFVAELGGEVKASGKKPSGEKFNVGIESPGDDELSFSEDQKSIHLGDAAVTTSGSYRRFRETAAGKISHIIDPRSGKPIRNNIISVTVVAKEAITADAFDNALMLMGVNKAIDFANKQKSLAAYIIYRNNEGIIKDTMSRNFRGMLR